MFPCQQCISTRQIGGLFSFPMSSGHRFEDNPGVRRHLMKKPNPETNQKPSNQETFCLLRIPVPKGTNHLMMCLFLHSSHASQLNRAVVVGLRRTQRVNVCKPSSMAALEREGHTPLKCQHQWKPKHISLPEPPKKDNFLKTELLLLLCLCKLLINRTETRRNRKKPKTVKQ